jgi:ribosomal protein L37AE/L43A
MASSGGPTSDKERNHRAATSAAMKRMAKSSQCPQCGRKASVKRTSDGDFVYRRCRYCKWETGYYLTIPQT